jgi:hemerythrin-like domain-containing protein
MIGVEQLKRVRRSEAGVMTDPLGMLFECHRKLERRLEALARAGEVLRDGSAAERLSAFFAIDMARAHFAGPLAKHTEDEERSLFPRLRRSDDPAARAALDAVAALEAGHRLADMLHAEFERAAAALPRDGRATDAEVERLNQAIAMLADHYRAHIRVENEQVFPAAARALTAGDLRQFAEEMRARRALTLRRD